eukprot:scaffold4829_cov129-Cylindrotheca_fusiformis.AAC.8
MAEDTLALRQPDLLDRVCEFTERWVCQQNDTRQLPEPRSVDMRYFVPPSSASSIVTTGSENTQDMKTESERDALDAIFGTVESFVCAQDVATEREQPFRAESRTSSRRKVKQQRAREYGNAAALEKKKREGKNKLEEKKKPGRETCLIFRPENRKLTVYRQGNKITTVGSDIRAFSTYDAIVCLPKKLILTLSYKTFE